MSNWEDDDSYCTGAQDFQDARAVAAELEHPAASRELRRAVSRARVRLLPHRISRRAHAEPRRAVQPGNQIRHLPRLRHAARRAALRHRTLRAPRTGSRQARRCSRRAIPDKDQSYFLHAVAREHFARVVFPLGELNKAEVRDARARGGLARVRQARQHRHLLHRRTSVSRIPRALHPHQSGRHRHRTRRGSRTPSRSRVLHAGPARRPRDRRPRGPARRRVVCRRQESRAQRTHRRAGTRSPAARKSCAGHRPLQLAGAASRAGIRFADQGSLSPGRPGLPRDR